jgi:diguanylate cyclase (GGDEF)-like protein
VAGEAPPGDVTENLKSLDGAAVGTLAWRKDRPGLEFIRRVAPGLGLSLLMLVTLSSLLVIWGGRQAKRILQSEAQATRAALTDPLTGLPNRQGLRENFARLLSEAWAEASTLGVLSVDIDQFKNINDAFGHTVGDDVLLATGKRLQGLLAPDALLARPDGDSFVLLVPRLEDSAAAELAADVVTTLAEPFDLEGGTRIYITASVGYAIGPRDGDAGDELLRRAELAVDKAKASTGEAAIAFAPEMDVESLTAGPSKRRCVWPSPTGRSPSFISR